MSRQALTGVAQIIKANTTEKSIDDLRAEGKKRVRVVSSDRVMTIIQAIVDDTISREVGEITKRDRDRIVTDTQERFSRVLKMQQDLEQDMDDLRGSLQTAELERDRLRGEKVLLEAQIEASRRTEGEGDAVARLTREMARVRDAVERTSREPGTIDDAALARVVEKLAAREAQSARRLGAEFEDLRTRLDAVARDATTARDAAVEKAIQRVGGRQSEAEAQLVARLERELRTVSERLAEMHAAAGRAPAADEAVSRLRAGLDALENRIHGVEKSSSETADRVAKAVLARLHERDAAESDRRSAGAAPEAAQLADTLRKVQRSSDETRQSILAEVASLRETVDGARSRPVCIDGEQVRDLAERIAAAASEATGALARTVERIDERLASLDKSIRAMRDEVGAVADRTPLVDEAEAQADAAARLDGVVADLRKEFAALTAHGTEAAERQEEAIRELREHVAKSAAVQSTAAQAEASVRLDGVVADLRKEFAALTAHGAEAAERQEEAIRALREHVAKSAAVQSTAAHAEATARIEAVAADLRGEFAALTARGAEAAERQEAGIRALREHVAQNAAVQSGSLETTFKGALELALDKITRTMERATARPIEMTGEATDVLLAKMFDVPDGEMTSNLGDLEVDQRHSKATIAKSVGRLKEMNGRTKSGGK